MNHEHQVYERYLEALERYCIAQDHFEYCELDFVDDAVADLILAEQNFKKALKELRNEMGAEVSNNQE